MQLELTKYQETFCITCGQKRPKTKGHLELGLVLGSLKKELF